jgi:hypothetical protein
MNRALTAATVYFLTLFALGFLLGSIRVLFVAPQIGVLGATLLEVPLMLAAASFLCRWAVGRLRWRRARRWCCGSLSCSCCLKRWSGLRYSDGRWAKPGRGWRRPPGWSA